MAKPPKRPKRSSTARLKKKSRVGQVYFYVMCTPQNGASLERLMAELSVNNVREFVPLERTRQQVIYELRERGFRVYDDHAPSPIVSASGPVRLFESVFKTKLVRKVITIDTEDGEIEKTFFDVAEGAPQPHTDRIPSVILIALTHPVVPTAAIPPNAPPDTRNVPCLKHPGDIAVLTNAALVHRQITPTGQRATGGGVRVAMIDTGFAPHVYYRRNNYRIHRYLSADATPPATDDAQNHGTRYAANLFSCAPDITLYAIKIGELWAAAFHRAIALSVKVISFSMVDDLSWDPGPGCFPGILNIPCRLVPLWFMVLYAISHGITVVCAAGNRGELGFPAVIPDVIAVGGATISTDLIGVEAWDGSSSFTSVNFPGRKVPDLCGIASHMALPDTPDIDDPDPWRFGDGATSAATPQVAAVAALLLQKDMNLSPATIKTILCETAFDVQVGTAYNAVAAGVGRDDATGFGLVDAWKAWNTV